MTKGRKHKDPKTARHLAELHAALFDTYDLRDVVRYIEEKTYLNGERFSFDNHEFQQEILSNTAKELNVQKCAQVGMTEAMARYAVGICRIMPYFRIIMTMPFAGDAGQFSRTRLDTFINDSPDLIGSIANNLNNSEVKALGTSLLYLRGCNGTTAALSVPADMLIHDEVDRSDPHVLKQFQSRMTHSDWKLTRKFGTPTMDKTGIAAEMAISKRMRHMVKCNHCSHTFLPSYHQHVHIPGYDRDKRELTAHNLNNYRWGEAKLLCPRCGAEPSLQKQHREWVCENPDSNLTAVGYYVIPFSVPNIVTIPSLVKKSTAYDSWTEFVNQDLGETATDNNKQLLASDVEQCKYLSDLASSELHCLGIDVGQICHIAVGRITQAGEFLIVHKETCVLDSLQKRKTELKDKWRCLITVIDAFPETAKVHDMQKLDKNLYGAVYHSDVKLATYQIVMVDEDLAAGKLPINQVRIMRDVNFDELMVKFKEKKVIWRADNDAEDALFVKQCTDMTRVQEFNKKQQMVYVWNKSKQAQDHYLHAIGYLHVACKLMPTVSRDVTFENFRIVSKIKIANTNETRVFGAIRR